MLTLTLIACLTPDGFHETWSVAFCDRYFECVIEAGATMPGGADGCVYDHMLTWNAEYQCADFDAGAAGDCLDWLDSATCAEIETTPTDACYDACTVLPAPV